MKKCTGNNTREWGFDAIFELACPRCGKRVEFFKDDITRNCSDIWVIKMTDSVFESIWS